MQLQSGQNIPLNTPTLSINILADSSVPALELDVSAFSLLASGTVAGDEGMSFYGQPVSHDGSIRVNAEARKFDIDLGKVPSTIEKIAICLTIDKGVSRGQMFSMVRSMTLELSDGADLHTFTPWVSSMSETALILGEVYRRNGQWKFRAVGQGFVGGLGPLARHFGVDISDDPDTGAQQGTLTSPPPRPLPKQQVSKPINLSKVTLEKRTPVNLNKDNGQFGKITVNLNWDQRKKGGLKGLLGGGGIDLDLGCLFEHRNGNKGVIQALGNSFGSFRTGSYCQLRGDDRTGASRDGEYLDINGDEWKNFSRVLIFAFIYEGTPNWREANAKITMKMPSQPELVVEIDSHSSRDLMCAVAMLENSGGGIKATKLVEYFPGHQEMDKTFGFGFRWTTGSK